ncbi:hypothetical protein Ahy_A01g000272 [Arachis hypogaea]|uniref:Nucleolar complex protein n=1 Tax=Arachis hypogaea TaxID=3818 RepID=A0A445EJS3_ARAHY|nr:hypothetical protein Ahy_A01g000272 [Arachis hypogaea]
MGKTKKNKKSNKNSGPDAIAMKLKASSKGADNPFESIWSRRKFDVLGQKRKGDTRRIGLARSLAIEKRKKTLLKEYKQSTKSSVFEDKRIGEGDKALDEFGKAILRTQRERQLNMKLSKKSKYHLSDEEDDFDEPNTLGLERDDFEDEMLPDDDGDEAYETKRKSALGLHMQIPTETSVAEGEANKKKTHAEVMKEIIAKSKYFKAEKAKEKEEKEELLDELDRKFTSLSQSQALVSLRKPNSNSQQEKPDEYDMLVKQMGLEMRARPSNRIKTPEEIAQEEREHLEEMEEERQKRMLASEDSSDEDNEDSEKASKQNPRSLSGDDLGDSFSPNEETMAKKGWIDEILERKDEEDSDSEESDGEYSDDLGSSEGADEGSDEDLDDHEKDLSLKDWEQSDDDNIGIDLEDEDNEEESKERTSEEVDGKNVVDMSSKKDMKDPLQAKKIYVGGKPSKELPYIIEAPKNIEELYSLLDNCSISDTILVINRIRKSNPITLAVENRKKMQVFYGVLLQYFAVMANKKPLNVGLLNMLGKPLIEMSMEIPYFAAICARRRIESIRKQFVESIKNPGKNEIQLNKIIFSITFYRELYSCMPVLHGLKSTILVAESSSWPSTKTLFLLRLWSMIFPCSDFRHPVMTPAILLMCEYLMRCRIVSGQDIAIGSFLCSMLLSVFRQSRKFCPEAIMFLQAALIAAAESNISHADSQAYQLMELKALKPVLCICETVNEISPLNFFHIMDMPEDSSIYSSDNFRASVLVAVIETLQGYVEVYEGLSSFPEIFLPILRILFEISEQKNMPNALTEKIKDVTELIKANIDKHHTLRRPLQMRKQKPVPIKLLNPKFEENYVKGRDYDPDRERAQKELLVNCVKTIISCLR